MQLGIPPSATPQCRHMSNGSDSAIKEAQCIATVCEGMRAAVYVEYPFLRKPSDDVMIWRYMDFTRFVSLLDRSALFFVRVDKLAGEGDRFEGFYPSPSVEEIHSNFPQSLPDGREVCEFRLEHVRAVRKCAAVSCWHMNEHESAAMWGIYLKSGKGVAIRSSFDRLKKSLSDSPEKVCIGVVEYIDYRTDLISVKYDLAPCFCKRKSYEYERELRAVIYESPTLIGNPPRKGTLELAIDFLRSHPGAFDEKLGGVYVPVCLEELIDKVYLSPGTPDWSETLTKSIMSKYCLEKEIAKSSLDDEYDLF